MATKLYVGNLSYDATEQQLRDLSSQAGEVSEVAVISDRYTGQSKGFGFVEMVTNEAAQDAIFLGVVLIPPACWWLEYTECVSEGTDMAGISYVLPALFLLFLLVALNRLARRRWPGRTFSQGELLTVFIMLSAGLTLGGPGGMQHLVMALGNVHWYANAGNGWARFHPLLPRWLFPPAEVLRE